MSMILRARITGFLAAFLGVATLCSPAIAGSPAVTGSSAIAREAPRRIISINMCMDQLLLDLAQPEQIVGLSPYARDRLRSWAAERASKYPALSGTAEEILILKPDLVVSGSFTKRATRELIELIGIPLVEFDAVRSLAETRAQILQFGTLVGAESRAVERVAALDAAIIRLRQAAAKQKLRVLPLARRGWVSGKDSLISDLLAQAGLTNAAGELGVAVGGFATLEAVVALRPDAILVTRDDFSPEDQGSAKLLHPGIVDLFPPERRIHMPERLTVCGGPMLVEAIDQLTRQIDMIKPRDISVH